MDEKSNEITAIPALLNFLAIKGFIITSDSISCQKDIAHVLAEKKGDYILALKGNQRALHDQVKDHFELEQKNEFKGLKYDYHSEYDKRHGRIEHRECWTTNQIDWIESYKDWVGLLSIAMVKSKRIIGDKETIETRYYLSSLNGNAQLIARSVRAFGP